MRLPCQDYLLFWDRKTKTIRIATGRFRGKIWSDSREAFFRRDWKYVGWLDGHRIKRINYNDKPFLKNARKGLRKVFMSALREMPTEFRRMMDATSKRRTDVA